MIKHTGLQVFECKSMSTIRVPLAGVSVAQLIGFTGRYFEMNKNFRFSLKPSSAL